jgi:hypothetical protein
VICDNLSAHKAPAVRNWLLAHPRFQLHFTPTYSSWISQVERWFAELQRRCLDRGVFCSLDELTTALENWIDIPGCFSSAPGRPAPTCRDRPGSRAASGSGWGLSRPRRDGILRRARRLGHGGDLAVARPVRLTAPVDTPSALVQERAHHRELRRERCLIGLTGSHPAYPDGQVTHQTGQPQINNRRVPYDQKMT